MAINLGNIVSIGGKSVGSGIASGLDTEALVKSLSDTKRLPAVKIEDTIKTNDTKITKFNDLRTLLDTLKTSTNFLRNPTGLNSVSQNVFKYRTTTLSASTFFTASASPGAAKGVFNFSVGNLAEARVVRTTGFTSQSASIVDASPSAGEFDAGSFDIAPVIATNASATLNTAETLIAGDYGVVGAAGNAVLATGISNFQVSGTGDTHLAGTITAVGGSYNQTDDELTLNFTLNGHVYTSNVIATDTDIGGGDFGIAASTTITFTNAATGTSFDVVTDAAYAINDDPDSANAFTLALQGDIDNQTITTQRNISSFDNTQVREPITGLAQSNIVFTTDSYSATGGIGNISGFTITRNGADDTDISVDINGVTYTALSLADNQTGNITLTSAGNKTLKLNIDDANIAFDFSSQNAADQVAAGLDYAFGTRELTSITLAAGDSLADIAGAINARSQDTGVTASIIQISSTDFRLQLRANKEGIDNSFLIVDDSGIWDQITSSEAQAAEDAVIAIDGIVTTRSTNTITDVVSGLTLNLTSETDHFTSQGGYNGLGSPEEVSVTIGDDTATAKTGIVNFVNAYNAYRVFVAEQTTRDEKGALPDDAVLATDTTMNVLVNQLGVEVVRTVAGVSDSTFAALAQIGITLTDFAGDDTTVATKGILQYDEPTLDAALANNFDKLREVFEANFTANSSSLSLFSSSNSTSLTDFKVQVVDATHVNVLDPNTDAVLFAMDRDGTLLTGRADTALEGTKFVFSGDNGDIITVHLTQGIGDRFYNILNPALEDDGTLDRTIDVINDNSDRLQKEVDRIDDQIESYRDQLLRQFSGVEEAISRINSLLQFLDVSSQALFSDN